MTGITDITRAAGDLGIFTYSYDLWGNRLAETSSAGGTAPSYEISSGNNQITELTYYAPGNLETDGLGDTFTYDAEGNLLQVNGGSTAAYKYDAQNRRVRSQTAAGTFEFLYDFAGRRTSSWLTSNNLGVEGRIYWDRMQITYNAPPLS